MDRMIRITGRASLSRKPDTVRITLHFSGTDPDYAAALQRAAERNEEIKAIAVSCGFADDALKTADFSVRPEYEDERDPNGVYHRVFKGYNSRQDLSLTFLRDDGLLNGFLNRVAASKAKPEFSLSFKLADPESVKEELVAAAVADSARKAKVISEAAGVSLGDIVNVDYSWETEEIFVNQIDRMAFAENKMMDFSLEPEDAVLTDTVTVTWALR